MAYQAMACRLAFPLAYEQMFFDNLDDKLSFLWIEIVLLVLQIFENRLPAWISSRQATFRPSTMLLA